MRHFRSFLGANIEEIQGVGFVTCSTGHETYALESLNSVQWLQKHAAHQDFLWLYREEQPDRVDPRWGACCTGFADSLSLIWYSPSGVQTASSKTSGNISMTWFLVRTWELEMASWTENTIPLVSGLLIASQSLILITPIPLLAVLPRLWRQRLLSTRRHINRQVNDPRFTFMLTVHYTSWNAPSIIRHNWRRFTGVMSFRL